MSFTLKDIKGAVVEKKSTWDGKLSSEGMEYNRALDAQSSVRLRLNREKLAEEIFNKKNEQMYGVDGLSWKNTDVKYYSLIPGTAVATAYGLADAIIVADKNIVEVEK